MLKNKFVHYFYKLTAVVAIFILGYTFANIKNNNNTDSINNANLANAISKFNTFFITLDKNYYRAIDYNKAVDTAILSVLSSLDNFSNVVLTQPTNDTKKPTQRPKINQPIKTSALSSNSNSSNNSNLYFASALVEYSLIDFIGYIKINSFNQGTAKETEKALYTIMQLAKQKNTPVKKIILNLIDNQGGLLTEAIKTTDLFLAYGLIATVPNYKSTNNYNKLLANYTASSSYLSNKINNIPIYILVNKNTASAAELVAGSLQANDRAIIMGEKTLGKNLIQSIFYLNSNLAVKFTTAAYVLSNGSILEHDKFNGVIPTIYLSNNIVQSSIDMLSK